MIDTLFGGSPTQLVLQALGNHKASDEELEEIQQLLNNLKNNKYGFIRPICFLKALAGLY
jgi:hypothetical protein